MRSDKAGMIPKEEIEEAYRLAYEMRREALAAYAHEAWSGWMNYLFDKSRMQGLDGCRRWEVVIPSDLVERWRQQVRTKYADLSEEEKESDRAEADKTLAIMGEIAP